MLNPRHIANPQYINAVRERARSEQIYPLDRERTGELARRIVRGRSSDAEYGDEDVPVVTTTRPSLRSHRR
jgi:hypothetical protein